MKKTVAVVSLCVCAAFGGRAANKPLAQVTWKTLPRYCASNVELVKAPVRGIVVEHHYLGWQSFKADDVRSFGEYARQGIVYISPHYSPWAWMNNYAVRLTDALIDVVKEHFEMDELNGDPVIVSTGGSMGGQGCLVWPCYSRHKVAAVVANCPVTDLVYHYTERPDLPRTIDCAFADEPDLQAALAAHSPFHIVKRMPDISYFIVHSSADAAVNKQKHSDRFVEAMRAAGRKVEYVTSEGTAHYQLTPEARRLFDAALLAPFAQGVK